MFRGALIRSETFFKLKGLTCTDYFVHRSIITISLLKICQVVGPIGKVMEIMTGKVVN